MSGPIVISPDTGEELSFDEETNSLVSVSGHSYPLLGDAACLLPVRDITDEIRTHREKAFGRRGAGHSWAYNHWYDLGLGELVPEGEGGLMLNFGSGDAREKGLLQDKGYKVVALDIDPMDGVDVVADGHTLPFRDNSFDAIVSFEVFEHLQRPWQVIEELSRVLKPGGCFVGSVAFLKPFHHSYFHMTHKGVCALLEYGGFSMQKVYGGQDFLSTLFRLTYPAGPNRWSMWFYEKLFSLTAHVYGCAWGLKNMMSPRKPLSRFDDQFQFSYLEWMRLRNAGCIVFRAQKNVI
jgi:SAM-dependent methyltransferase